jgi:hypothetical protein
MGSSSKTELRTDIPKWVYRYDKSPGKWTRILPNNVDFENEVKPEERPQPRYAHQLVYDSKTDTVFMHGGNGGMIIDSGSEDIRGDEEPRAEEESRLDDFWAMKLKRQVSLLIRWLISRLSELLPKRSSEEPLSSSELSSEYVYSR